MFINSADSKLRDGVYGHVRGFAVGWVLFVRMWSNNIKLRLI